MRQFVLLAQRALCPECGVIGADQVFELSQEPVAQDGRFIGSESFRGPCHGPVAAAASAARNVPPVNITVISALGLSGWCLVY